MERGGSDSGTESDKDAKEAKVSEIHRGGGLFQKFSHLIMNRWTISIRLDLDEGQECIFKLKIVNKKQLKVALIYCRD